MYQPHVPQEPSGCAQTFVISRIILGILLVPVTLIVGAIGVIILTFIALSVSPFLALVPFILGGAVVYLLTRWEAKRIARENPPDDPL